MNNPGAKRVLNVGGGSKAIPLPPHYYGWDHILLDVASGPDVDIVLDARLIHKLPALTHKYDAVYCSHNIEHYYKHEVVTVIRNFQHVLAHDGFVEIRVPDICAVFQAMATHALDIDDTLYATPSGPITPHDVIYGHGVRIATGNEFYAHKCGFTPKSLGQALVDAGFGWVQVGQLTQSMEICALARVKSPAP